MLKEIARFFTLWVHFVNTFQPADLVSLTNTASATFIIINFALKTIEFQKLPQWDKDTMKDFRWILWRLIQRQTAQFCVHRRWSGTGKRISNQRFSWAFSSVFYASASNFKPFHAIRWIFIFSSRWNFGKDGRRSERIKAFGKVWLEKLCKKSTKARRE